MNNSEKWNKICNLYEKSKNLSELQFQSIWEGVFAEYFSYSKLEGDIESQRKLHLGSTDRLVPDIILKKEQKDLFIVELKQGNMQINQKFEEQIKSYMNQLKLNIGIFICNKIWVLDYDYTVPDGIVRKISIDFETDNPVGIEIIKLFSKENFNREIIQKFIKERIEKKDSLEKLSNELENSNELIMRLLKEHFASDFTEKEIEEVFGKFVIRIERKTNNTFSINKVPQVKKVVKNISRGSITISRSTAISLCKEAGIYISGNVTFASTNSTTGTFWANPSVGFLKSDWWLLLNDKEQRELHVLFITKNTLSINDVVVRSDKPHQIDLQIRNDSEFQDTRSKVVFSYFYKKTIDY